MPQTTDRNRRIILASRPHGAPTPDAFRLEEAAVPVPAEGQVLARTVWLSLDPYMRGRMNEGPSYVAPVDVGAPMGGEAVCRVVSSRHPDFAEGDLVVAAAGWQDYAVVDGGTLRRLDPAMPHPSYALGVLGMPGFTAYTGLLDIGRVRAGETVVVAAATGAVGAVVGQIARLKGARAVGVAGSADKCRYAVDELGFDACLNHRDPELPAALKAVCPDGIDVYFENVGGAVLDAVVPRLNVGARVPVCGLIAYYNLAAPPPGPDRTPRLLRTVLVKRVTLQGFLIYDHWDGFPAFLEIMGGWLADGSVQTREDRVEGLENAPAAFIGLLEGRNFGKLVVQVGAP